MIPILYRIYYKFPDSPTDEIVYIGRTKNNLTQRLRNHFFKHPFQRVLDIEAVTHIEYTELATVADMFVAEIVLINKLKPLLNVDDKAGDELTIEIDLSGMEWKLWDKVELIEKWKGLLVGK